RSRRSKETRPCSWRVSGICAFSRWRIGRKGERAKRVRPFSSKERTRCLALPRLDRERRADRNALGRGRPVTVPAAGSRGAIRRNRGRSHRRRHLPVERSLALPEAAPHQEFERALRGLHVPLELARVLDGLLRLVRQVLRPEVELATRLIAPLDELALREVLRAHDAVVQTVLRDPFAEVTRRDLALVLEIFV